MSDLRTEQKRYHAEYVLSERVRPLGFALDLRNSANRHFVCGGSAPA